MTQVVRGGNWQNACVRRICGNFVNYKLGDYWGGGLSPFEECVLEWERAQPSDRRDCQRLQLVHFEG